MNDEIEIKWHGEPPKKQEKSNIEKAFNWLYYNGCGCFVFFAFILTPIAAVLIAIFS